MSILDMILILGCVIYHYYVSIKIFKHLYNVFESAQSLWNQGLNIFISEYCLGSRVSSTAFMDAF